MRYAHLKTILLVLAVAAGAWIHPDWAAAGTAAELDHDAKSALQNLYATSPSARMMGERAKGILVFPSIVKGGFLVGGQFGKAESMTTTTLQSEIYAFFFDQKGLMGGLGLQGTQITRIQK